MYDGFIGTYLILAVLGSKSLTFSTHKTCRFEKRKLAAVQGQEPMAAITLSYVMITLSLP